MDLSGALTQLQALAVSRMTDTCRITRAGAITGDDMDPVTGLPPSPTRTTVYEGKCRIRTGGTISAGSQRQVSGDTVTAVASLLHLPIDAPAAKVNDRVEILSSINPTLLSLYTVSGIVPSSQMTAQRVQVTAVID